MTVGFAKVSIKGEGIMVVGVVLLLPCHPVDSRLRGNDGVGVIGRMLLHPVDTVSSPV